MNCKALIHPFKYDTGTSQSQRIMDDLLEGPHSWTVVPSRICSDIL